MKDFKYMSPRHLMFRNDWKCTLYGYAAKSIMPKIKITDDIVLDITVFFSDGRYTSSAVFYMFRLFRFELFRNRFFFLLSEKSLL